MRAVGRRRSASRGPVRCRRFARVAASIRALPSARAFSNSSTSCWWAWSARRSNSPGWSSRGVAGESAFRMDSSRCVWRGQNDRWVERTASCHAPCADPATCSADRIPGTAIDGRRSVRKSINAAVRCAATIRPASSSSVERKIASVRPASDIRTRRRLAIVTSGHSSAASVGRAGDRDSVEDLRARLRRACSTFASAWRRRNAGATPTGGSREPSGSLAPTSVCARATLAVRRCEDAGLPIVCAASKWKTCTRRRLADAIDPADALFEPHRVPRQFQVDDGAAVLLEVESLAGGVGREEDASVGERGERRAAFVSSQPAVNDGRIGRDAVPQMQQRVAILGEDQHRFAHAPQQSGQRRKLRLACGGGRRRVRQRREERAFFALIVERRYRPRGRGVCSVELAARGLRAAGSAGAVQPALPIARPSRRRRTDRSSANALESARLRSVAIASDTC